MTYIHFIGIDVSKDWLDVVIYAKATKPQRFQNNSEGFAVFAAQYGEQIQHALLVLESTGGYETAFITFALLQQWAVHRADPLTAKHFIRSLRLRGKTDMLDAAALARYGAERGHTLPCLSIPDADQQELAALASRRSDLMAMHVMEKQRSQHPRYAKLTAYVQPILEAIRHQIVVVETRMKTLVNDSKTLRLKSSILVSVKGVGSQTAISLLAAMPELGKLTRRQAAALAGCAPHPKDSGKSARYRATGGGRATVKQALYMASLSASRFNPTLRDFYDKLIKNGKKPMVALTAVMRKLITILNAKIRDEIYPTT